MAFAESLSSSALSPQAPPAAVEQSTRRWGLLLYLSAGLLGALVAWPWLIHFENRFPVENLSVEMTNRIRNNREDPIAWAQERHNRWTSLHRNTAVCLAGFGLAVGAALAMAAGVARRSARLVLLGAVTGAACGAVAGAAGGVLEAALLMRLEGENLQLAHRTVAGHAVGWSVAFAGMALGVAIVVGRLRRAPYLIGSVIVAGMAAAALYSPLAAILFPLDRSDFPIPEGDGNKLLFAGLAAGFAGLGLGRAQRGSATESAVAVGDPLIPAEDAIAVP